MEDEFNVGEEDVAVSRGPAKVGGGPGCIKLPRLQQPNPQSDDLLKPPRKYTKRIQSMPHLKAAGVAVSRSGVDSMENGVEPYLFKFGYKGPKLQRALMPPTDYTESS